jgi:Tfp pilus assembly protein PilO
LFVGWGRVSIVRVLFLVLVMLVVGGLHLGFLKKKVDKKLVKTQSNVVKEKISKKISKKISITPPQNQLILG